MLHHPLDWLTPFDLSRNEVHLKRKFNFILHGHAHKPGASAIRDNFGYYITIPAGACYDRSMPANSAYTYSYNYVHLDFDTDKGCVFLRRWSDLNRVWWKDDETCPPNGEFHFSISGSDKAPIPHQIPPPPKDFKGREDEIRDILSNFEKGATITGLRGMGGVGKTALALVLADKTKNQFPDGQIFIDMRGTSNNPELPPLMPEEAMAQVVRAYNPVDRLPENSGELRGLYRSVLAGKRVLLLLDNAANCEQVEPLLPPAGCLVLITSRFKFTLPGLAEKDLDILPLDKASELLLEIAPRIGKRADDLAKLCGYLPLALRNAASALAERKDLSISEYERRLSDKVARIELVKASFSLSYDLLSPGRKKQWSRLSVFPEYFSRDSAIAVLKMAPRPSAEALSDLVKWSLVDFIPGQDSEIGRYRLHDLARLFAESCLTNDDLVDAQQKHAKHFLKILSDANKRYIRGGSELLAGLELFDREWSNIKVGQSWAKGMIRISRRLNKSDRGFIIQMASSYANDGVHIIDLRLHPRERIGWLDTGLTAARMKGDRGAEGVQPRQPGQCLRRPGRDAQGHRVSRAGAGHRPRDRRPQGRRSRLGNLGNAYAGLGETRKAIEYYDQALAISREIGDRRGEGADLGNLGNAYAGLGETRKAIEYYDQAWPSPARSATAGAKGADLGNLGNGLRRAGRDAQGHRVLRSGAGHRPRDRRPQGRRSRSGQPGPGLRRAGRDAQGHRVLRSGAGHRPRDRRPQGRRGRPGQPGHWPTPGWARRARPSSITSRRWPSPARSATAGAKETDLGNLGNAYADLGETRKAIEYHDQALAISREIGDRRGEGAGLGNLGLAYAGLGETRKAIEYHDQALAIAREIGDRQNEGEFLCNLGKACLDLNETDKAIEHCTQSLDLVRKIEYRKIEGEALCTLGKAYTNLGEIDKALDHCDQALKIFEKMEYRRGEAEALFNKSLALDKLARREDAVDCAQKSLQIFAQIESPQAEKVRQKLAEWGAGPQEN